MRSETIIKIILCGMNCFVPDNEMQQIKHHLTTRYLADVFSGRLLLAQIHDDQSYFFVICLSSFADLGVLNKEECVCQRVKECFFFLFIICLNGFVCRIYPIATDANATTCNIYRNREMRMRMRIETETANRETNNTANAKPSTGRPIHCH